MKKYTYLVNFDSQALERVGESFTVKGDGGIAELEFIIPSDFGIPPTQAVWRAYYKLPGERESLFETLPTVEQTESGDYVTGWVISKALTQTSGRLGFSLAAISGNNVQWTSRTVIMQVQESQYQPDSEETEEPYSGRLTALEGDMAAIRGEFGDVMDEFEELKETATLGTPIPKSLASEMVEGGVYLYTGSETGYNAGHVYYYVSGVLTDGGQYGGIAIDDTLTSPIMAAPASEVGKIKEDLSAIQTATAEDAGKALKVKTVANGKVTEWEFGATGDENAVPFPVSPESKYGTSGQVLQTLGNGNTKWATVGEPDPAVIENAVYDWLDENPEATTTVEDGSITEAKLATALVPTLKNNYVTPEMFGAVGDGVTDDTAAINAMFASDNVNFVFGNKTYITDGSIDITKTCQIWFNDTLIRAKQARGVRDFEYMLAIRAKVWTFGRLSVNAYTSVNICILLAGCGGSHFDCIHVGNARIWGVWLDKTTDGNNSITFNALSAGSCGNRISGKASVAEQKQLQITGMTYSRGAPEMYASLFSGDYDQARYVIDDSLYVSQYAKNRYVFYNDALSSPFVVDEGGYTSGIFTTQVNIPSTYNSDEGRAVIIPVGGGINLQSAHSEGVLLIHKLTTQSNAIGTRIGLGYGGSIGSYASEYDTVMLANYNAMSLTINYLYAEAVGTGFKSKFNNGFDAIMVISPSDNAKVYLNDSFRLPLKQGNVVTLNLQDSAPAGNPNVVKTLNIATYIAARKLPGLNVSIASASFAMNVDEYTPRLITLDSNGFTSTKNVTINLVEKNPMSGLPVFEPLILFIKKRHATAYNDFGITLHSDLASAGYTLRGSVNNALTIHPSDYGNIFKVTIMLFSYTKEFCVTAEPLTFVDNTQT